MTDQVLSGPVVRPDQQGRVNWQQRLAWPVFAWLTWRVWLGVIGVWAASLPLAKVSSVVRYEPPDPNFWVDRLLTIWKHWDGVWFLYIAQFGYKPEDFSTPYFPLYPLLVRALSWLTLGNSMVAGVLLSNLFALSAFVLLYELIRYEVRPVVARRTVTALAVFPTSLFLAACYSESLFLALALGAFLAARRYRNWWAVGLLVGLAAVTRNIGILLLLPLGWEWLRQHRAAFWPADPATTAEATPESPPPQKNLSRFWPSHFDWRATEPGATAVFVLTPLLTYGSWLLFQAITQGNPFSFVSAVSQPGWDRHSTPPWQTLWDVISIWRGTKVIPVEHPPWIYESILLVFALFLFGVACYQAWRGQMPGCYLLYLAVALFVPLSAPNLDDPLLSFPRYIMVAFPMYLIIAQARPIFRVLYLVPSFLLLTYCMAQFANWYLVA